LDQLRTVFYKPNIRDPLSQSSGESTTERRRRRRKRKKERKKDLSRIFYSPFFA
jgi:hypothetical protein